jgi:uncharacterized protein YjbI with pentapeptide repeats
MNAEELIERYRSGEREFSGQDLSGVDLYKAALNGVNLTQAELQ